MAKPTYREQLLDPRWQKKRLEILHRANFTCEGCGSKDKTLHVHHGYYERDTFVWEYEDSTLWCLCVDCHSRAESYRRDAHYELAKIHPLRISPMKIIELRTPEDNEISERRGERHWTSDRPVDS